MEDRVLRLQVDCQEMTTEDEAILLGLRDSLGWFLFAENSKDIQPEDMVDLPEIKTEKGHKTDSQRLRATLFVYWKQQKRAEDFELFYKQYINKVIENIKSKLPTK